MENQKMSTEIGNLLDELRGHIKITNCPAKRRDLSLAYDDLLKALNALIYNNL